MTNFVLPVEIECAGKLADWSAAANRLFASGCEAQGLALLASFAAPLMRLFRTDEGGAVVSIHGGKKSGKSIAHAAAASVWGEPETFALGKFSGVTRYTMLGSLCNLPAFDDTLANRDPEVVRTFLTNFIGGVEGLEWQTVLLSFSPVPLGDVPGIEVEVKVPPALHIAHARSRDPLAYELISNRGNAGAMYWTYLCDERNQNWAKKALASQVAEMMEMGPTDDQVYTIRAVAACHVAGQIVTRLGILEFDPDRITRWARERAFAKEVAQ